MVLFFLNMCPRNIHFASKQKKSASWYKTKNWGLCLAKVVRINIKSWKRCIRLQKLDVVFGKLVTDMAKLLGRVHAQGGGQGENNDGPEQRIQKWSYKLPVEGDTVHLIGPLHRSFFSLSFPLCPPLFEKTNVWNLRSTFKHFGQQQQKHNSEGFWTLLNTNAQRFASQNSSRTNCHRTFSSHWLSAWYWIQVWTQFFFGRKCYLTLMLRCTLKMIV